MSSDHKAESPRWTGLVEAVRDRITQSGGDPLLLVADQDTLQLTLPLDRGRSWSIYYSKAQVKDNTSAELATHFFAAYQNARGEQSLRITPSSTE